MIKHYLIYIFILFYSGCRRLSPGEYFQMLRCLSFFSRVTVWGTDVLRRCHRYLYICIYMYIQSLCAFRLARLSAEGNSDVYLDCFCNAADRRLQEQSPSLCSWKLAAGCWLLDACWLLAAVCLAVLVQSIRVGRSTWPSARLLKHPLWACLLGQTLIQRPC